MKHEHFNPSELFGFAGRPAHEEPAENQGRAKLDSPLDEALRRIAMQKKAAETDPLGLADTVRNLEQQRVLAGRKLARRFLPGSVTPLADRALLADDPTFLDQFLPGAVIRGFVLSLDLRNSADMMLKARIPGVFASLLDVVMRKAETIIKAHYGVFDKFTGDGCLAFFPDFFSGPDACRHVIRAAMEAIQAFNAEFAAVRGEFHTIRKDGGIAAGIDYGEMTILGVCAALTVVGPPVVYACRLGGAPGGRIYVGHKVFDLLAPHAGEFSAAETGFSIKHEPAILVYAVHETLAASEQTLRSPEWAVVHSQS